MRIVSSFLLSLVIAGALPAIPARALSTVALDEIAWMGTATSTSDEWIELHNPTDSMVNIEGWLLAADDGTPTIMLSGSIASGGFFLLERSSDDTIPGVSADQIYTGALGNSGERFTVRDENGAIVDTVDASSGWPAGDNATKQTMERALDGSWGTSTPPGGTPKAPNSIWWGQSPPPPPPTPSPIPSPALFPPSPSPTSSPAPSSIPTPNQSDSETFPPAPTASSSPPPPLILSELLPDPEGLDNEEEFVEIFNAGGETATLDGWRIRDASGATLALKSFLAPGSYAAFRAADTDLPSLNNDGDTIELLDPSGIRRDGVRYGNAQEGSALARSSAADGMSWVWTAKPTPGAPNTISQETRLSPTSLSPLDNAPSAIVEAPPAAGDAETASISNGSDDEEPLSSAVGALNGREEHDGSSLAAALRSAGSPTGGGWPSLSIAALIAVLAGLGVFAARVWLKRRREPAFVVKDNGFSND